MKGWNGVPTTLYRAMKLQNGKVVCVDVSVLSQTSKVVRSSDEFYKATGQGWCSDPQEALERFEQAEEAVGQAAAERAYTDLRMSEKAQREAEAYEKTVPGVQHVPVIPEARK